MEVKAPHMLDGTPPVPYSAGVARPVVQIDPQQMRMFLMHRSNLRSQHPSMKPPTGATGVVQSPKHPNMNCGSHVLYENGPLLQVTKVSSHECVPSNATSITVSMNANVETLPSFDKAVMGYSIPPGVVSNQGNGAATATRPATLALPVSTAICNSSLTYSVAPMTTVSSVMSMDINKSNNGGAVPPLQQPMIPSSAVDSNAYMAYHNGQNGSASFCSTFQGQGGPVSVTPAQTPGPIPTHTPAPLPTPGSNISTPLQTSVTGVPQLPHAAHVATPPAPPPAASQTSQPPNQSAPSCSTCGCNGLCTTATSASNTGYPQVMWNHHAMFPGYPLNVMPVTSNGLVPPNLPFSHPLQTMNLPNGMNPDIVYNNQPHNFNVIQQSDGAPNVVFVTSANSGSFNSGSPSHAVPTNTESTNGKGKVVNCYNCGEAGHRAVDCRELTMESLTHSGVYVFHVPS